MILTIASIILIALSFLGLLLQRLLSVVPAYELRRLAAKHDPLAQALYRPVAYGATLRLTLWIVFFVSLTAGLIMLLPQLNAWAQTLVILGTLIITVAVLPAVRLTVRLANFAAQFSGILSWLLVHIHRPLDVIVRMAARFRAPQKHSGLYEKSDLLDLLESQKQQPDNRILEEELELTGHLLQFSDKQAADIMKPRTEVLLVNENETIGPLLLDRLHQAGQGLALVFRGRKSNIVGVLRLQDAASARAGGQVSKFVQSDLLFVHEDHTLPQVLDAFRGAARPLAVVVNGSAEFVGAISLEDLLQSLVGPQTERSMANYDDPKVVAAYDPTATVEPVHTDLESEPSERETRPTPSPEATEVVE